MELDITHLRRADLIDYAASAMELGRNAGRITWENAMRDADELIPLTTDEQIEKARDYIRSTGGWTHEEIDSWDAQTIRALVLQFVAGHLREYLKALSRGRAEFRRWDENHGGHIYRGSRDRRLYYYLGN